MRSAAVLMRLDLCWHASPQIRHEPSNRLTTKRLLLSSGSTVHQTAIFIRPPPHNKSPGHPYKDVYKVFFFYIFCHCSLICLFSSVCLKSLFEDYVKWWEAKDVLTLPCYLGGSHHIIVADVNFNTIESEGLSSWVQLWFLPRCSTLSASFQKGKLWRPAASLFLLKVFSFHTYLFFASLSLLKFLKVFRCKSLNGIE